MEQKKPLGSGIEAISHFFLSPSPRDASFRLPVEEASAPLAVRAGHRVLALTSQTPGVPAVYWSTYLAEALAAGGQKVLLIDVETAPDRFAAILDIPVYPSLSAFLKQPFQAMTVEAPGGFRTLSFQIRINELDGFKPVEREILFGILLQEEREADVLLINIQFDALKDNWIPYLHPLHEAVLVVSPDDALAAYRILKILFSIRPGLRLGLVETGGSQGSPRNVADSLLRAAQQFMQKCILNLGDIPVEIRKRAGMPDEALRFEHPSREAMREIGQKIIQGLNRRGGQSPFFERLQDAMRRRISSYLSEEVIR